MTEVTHDGPSKSELKSLEKGYDEFLELDIIHQIDDDFFRKMEDELKSKLAPEPPKPL